MGRALRLLLIAIVTGNAVVASTVPAPAAEAGCTPGEPVDDREIVANPNGPYYHQVRIGTMADGVVQGDQLLADHASVPDAVTLEDGDIAVYFVNGAKNIMARGVFDGEGLLHDRRAVVIDGVKGGSAVDPDVIRLPDGTIRLAYFNGFGPPDPEQDHVMCIADSTDGIHFESVGEIFRGTDLTDPSLTVHDGVWYLAVSHGTESYIARSDDGLEFEQVATVLGGVPEITTGDDGSLHLYVCEQRGVVHLTSHDGVTWTGSDSVLPPGTCDPSVVVDTDSFVYKTFATRAPRPPSPPG
ncbi:MAG: hypothetical protein FJW86_11795 [Actinobacteria bacterium]|nr:hypothetical protein [Actinomycetota bacterium]